MLAVSVPDKLLDVVIVLEMEEVIMPGVGDE